MPSPIAENIQIFSDATGLQQAVADVWVSLAREAIAERGQFCMALSGGSTPKALYELMASTAYRQAVDWRHCHFFFGDERYVPADHSDSNYRMARTALFEQVDIPVTNIHQIDTTFSDPQDSARAYDELLQTILPCDVEGRPVFDLMLQGVGDDGHTASLFPGASILAERNCNVAATYVEKFNAWRISVTFPVIDHARHVLFLVSGSGKAQIIKTLLRDPVVSPAFPVQMIHARGRLEWYLDRDAAALLT